MDALQVAGHLSLEFGAAVEGPFTGPHKGDQVARVWLANKRGVSLLWQPAYGRIDMITIRETVPDRDVTYDGTPWRTDQSTPVVNGGESAGAPDVVLKAARRAVAVLRGLPAIDPRDQRSTQRDDVRQWSAVHYGESLPACGGTLRDDDECTTDLKRVRCPNCLEEVNRSA
jgi:hypothetical protein